jgi:hypothetical protein
VLAAEHLLCFPGVDRRREIVEAAGKIIGHRLPRLGPFHQHREIVSPAPERVAQIAVLFEPAAALQQFLGRRLVLPEVRLGYTVFD